MNKKYSKYINTFFITLPMTFIMSFVGIAKNYGFKQDWFQTYIITALIMFPIAFCSALIITPLAEKITNKITK